MTIDKAIRCERKRAEESRNMYVCLLETSYQYQMKHKEEMDNYKQSAEEHEQLAEWLEELQSYKQGNCTNDCEHFDNGVKYGYEKGIDDFVKECEKQLTDMILQHQGQLDFASGLAIENRVLDDVAEKLKAGGTNGNPTTGN